MNQAEKILLKGKIVNLITLNKNHFKNLYEIALNKAIWEFYPVDCSDEKTFSSEFNKALIDMKNGTQYAFAIVENITNGIIGSTRFLDINHYDKRIEIGWTWLKPEYWKSGLNFECKLLMLQYCFETLKYNRVQLKTNETNIRSRKAIEKIGAKFEGIMRKDRMQQSGIPRNTAYYSIIDTEWSEVKKMLQEKIDTIKLK